MKISKKVLALVFALCGTMVNEAFARDADHTRFFPDFKDAAFDAGNLYFGLEGTFALPVVFTGDQKIAGIGGGGAFEMGYDLDGWLMGFHGEWRFNTDNGNYMKDLKNIFITAEISKLFVIVPSFLELRATVGAGADLIHTVFYPNELYKNIGKTVKEDSIAMIYGAGAELEFTGPEHIIPYIGADAVFSSDKSGLFMHSSMNLGIRTTVRRLAGPAPKGNPGIGISSSPDVFTPDGDGKDDSITIKLKSKYQKGATPKSWKVEVVQDFGGRPFVIKTFKGEGKLPKKIVWDGKSDNPRFIPLSASEYRIVATAEDSQGNINSQETTCSVGILVQKQKDGSLKILVNSIMFDPNKATFDTLTEREKRMNNFAIRMISRALKKYGDYSVVIEGHAHNISGTQQEETEELIPLSTARAKAICDILVKDGIAKNRLTAVGKGGKEPISTEPEQNRRVEFKLVK